MTVILNDYPNRFLNLTGDLIEEQTQSAWYNSKECLEGASQCRVIKYSASGKDVYSWEARFPVYEEFTDARKQFRKLYNQLQQVNFTSGNSQYSLRAKYTEPTEDRKFNSILFMAGNTTASPEKLRVELLLEADMLEWTVRVLVYDKERDDNEKGPLFERDNN